MPLLKVNQISSYSGNTLTVGTSGDTIIIPSGTTFNASSASVNLPAISLTTGVTGTLPVANGGTNLTTYTAGNLLYASNSTTLTTLPIGTSTQVLGVSSGLPAWTSVSSDYVLLASSDASSSASVSFDGYYSSTYKNYKVIISDFIPATNNIGLWIRYNQSGSPVTASYQYITTVTNSTVSIPDYSAGATGSQSDTKINLNALNDQTSTAGFCLSAEVTIFNPLNTANYKRIQVVGSGMQGNNTYHWLGNTAGLYKGNTSALSGITFLCSAGNIVSGNFKLYGLK